MTSRPMAITGPHDFGEAFKVPRETIHRLVLYAELLAEWQTRANLVSAKTLPEMWDRHFADSAQLMALAPDAQTWLDLGSGAGFPGSIIAILAANREGFRMHLVESTAKKCDFLAEVARTTQTPVDIHCMRIEELARRSAKLGPDIISARACAPLPQLLELAAPFFRAETRGLFLKGRNARREIDAARQLWKFDVHRHPSLTATDSSIVEITNLAKRRNGKVR
jgi:16S rRNA (guanine527-N7)-methyltransferase